MPSWKKIITSGSAAILTNVTASSFTGSFTGSLSGTSSFATSASFAVSSSRAVSSSFAISASYALTASYSATASYVTPLNQNVTVNGLLSISGSIIPSVSKSFSLGSTAFPFRDLFISSGSLVIASDNPGAPSTTISNTDGNILISAGGMQLVGSGSFNATTGSFQYISGSMTQVGNYVMIGDKTITGSLTLSSGSALSINNGFYVDGQKQFNYGQFSSTQTQIGLANTAYPMTFDTVDFQNGIVLVGGPGNSSIAVVNTGVYNIQFSTQLHTIVNQSVDFSIWFAKNGTDIPNSNTDFTIEKVSGGGFVVAALNFLIQLESNDYIQLKYSKTTLEGQLQAKGPQINPTRPATPSVIVTVTQVA